MVNAIGWTVCVLLSAVAVACIFRGIYLTFGNVFRYVRLLLFGTGSIRSPESVRREVWILVGIYIVAVSLAWLVATITGITP